MRLSNEPEVGADGALVSGATWPANSSVAWSVVEGQVVVPPKPRATPTPKPTKKPKKAARPTATPEAPAEPSPSPVIAGIRTISVQWRDVAGNWSEPIAVDVWYAPEGSVARPRGDARAVAPPRRHRPRRSDAIDGSGSAEAPASEAPVAAWLPRRHPDPDAALTDTAA